MAQTSYLTGITPLQVNGTNPPDGAGVQGTSTSVGTTSTAATELSKAQVGAAVRGVSGADTTPYRYAERYLITAVGAGISIRFGTSGVSAATAADVYLSPGIPYIYTRPYGVTHFRAISEDGSTSGLRLKMTPLEWSQEQTD